jgi:integrase/recombinase XerC
MPIDNAYIKELRLQGTSPGGLKSAHHKITLFFRFLESAGYSFGQIDRQVCYDYQQSLMEQEITRKTVRSYMNEVKRFCEYLATTNQLRENPMEFVQMPKAERPLPKGLLKEPEIDQFLEALGRWHGEGKHLMRQGYDFRHHVMAEVQFSSGMRIGDLAVLKDSDVDWEKGTLYVKGGKGSKEAVGFLSEYTLDLLKLWRELRPLVLKPQSLKTKLLFGGSVSGIEKAYNLRLNEVAKTMGKDGWHSHLFRHEFGYLMLRSGCSIRHIQQLLNHRNITTTEIYTKVDVEDVRRVLDSYHPRGQQ